MQTLLCVYNASKLLSRGRLDRTIPKYPDIDLAGGAHAIARRVYAYICAAEQTRLLDSYDGPIFGNTERDRALVTLNLVLFL